MPDLTQGAGAFLGGEYQENVVGQGKPGAERGQCLVCFGHSNLIDAGHLRRYLVGKMNACR